MFSRVGRSISQISRSMNVLKGGNGGRSQILTDSTSVIESRYASRELAADSKFGVVLKRYLGSLAANNQRKGSVLSDINSVFLNPRNRRFFHSLQKKKKKETSTKEKVVFVIISASVAIGSYYFASIMFGDTLSKLERYMILREKRDKLKEEMLRECKMKAEEEKEG